MKIRNEKIEIIKPMSFDEETLESIEYIINHFKNDSGIKVSCSHSVRIAIKWFYNHLKKSEKVNNI